MGNNKTIDGVPRGLLEAAIKDVPLEPSLIDHCCVGCGNWMPKGHAEAHEHDNGCPEVIAATARHWRSQLHALLAKQPTCAKSQVEPAVQPQGGITHWANPEYSETITAELKAHNMSFGGAPAAAVARYTIALGPIIQHQGEPVAFPGYPPVPEARKLAAEQPAPASGASDEHVSRDYPHGDSFYRNKDAD